MVTLIHEYTHASRMDERGLWHVGLPAPGVSVVRYKDDVTMMSPSECVSGHRIIDLGLLSFGFSRYSNSKSL